MTTLTGLEAPPERSITEADVAGFAAKLEAWYETLPPSEQAMLNRLLACAEGMAPEQCDVEGYALTGIGARLARIFAAGLMAATLAAPMAASAAPGFFLPVNPVTAQLTQPPEQAILAKALALGASFTGSALSGLETVPNGHCKRYQKCDIYYSDATGAHEVHGDIRDKYNLMGGALGHVGLPRTDELTTSDGRGRYSEFSFPGTAIYSSPDTGPFAVEGNIRRAWVANDAERRLGYPTGEALSGNGGQWQDFQNDVLYFEGSQQRAPVTARLSREQLAKALRNFFHSLTGGTDPFGDFQEQADSLEILGVSKTGYDFSQSRNRLINIRIEGHKASDSIVEPAPARFLIDLSLLFFAQKEADGSTTLRVALHHQNGYITGRSHLDELAEFVDDRFVKPFASPRKLINVNIPAAVPVLSLKVLEDGTIKLCLQPGGGAPLTQLAVQLALDRLAK